MSTEEFSTNEKLSFSPANDSSGAKFRCLVKKSRQNLLAVIISNKDKYKVDIQLDDMLYLFDEDGTNKRAAAQLVQNNSYPLVILKILETYSSDDVHIIPLAQHDDLLKDEVSASDEVVETDGSRQGVAQADRASRVFTQSFTRMYRRMAQKSPIWAQLRNLIDLSVAAAFIRDQGFYEMADWTMPIFSDEGAYPVQTYHTPVRVETAVNVRWKGNTLMTPVGGGVRIEATEALRGVNLKSDEKGSVKQAHAAVQPGEVDHDRWWWD